MKTVITITDGAVAITQDDKPLNVTAAQPRTDADPVGPFDQFTRPWRPGDRNPTGEEMMFKPDWFKEYGKEQPGPQTGGGTTSGGKVPFSIGGRLALPYPAGTQRGWELTGVAAGMCALALGKMPAGSRAGGGYLSLVGAHLDTCPIVRTAWATEPGVFVGPAVLGTPGGATNRITSYFVVGKQGGGGFGPELPVGQEVFFNVEFAEGVPAEVRAEIAAHDRG